MASPRVMVTVTEARERARKRVDQDQRDWAAVGGTDAVLDVVLRPPTESIARSDQGAAIAWVGAWRAADDADSSVSVSWGLRQWPSIGTQSVPERAVIRGADAIAAFAGATYSRGWRTLRDRAEVIRSVLGFATEPDGGTENQLFTQAASGVGASRADEVAAEVPGEFAIRASFGARRAAVIRAHARTVQRLDNKDFETLIEVVTWLRSNPASGWRIRQLPIRGIDTKWLERHRPVVEALHSAVSGSASLGLADAPNLVRVRFLDPMLRPGGLCDVTAPVEELAALDVAPTTVFVFENLETIFAMPEIPGAVVVHGSGFAIPRLRKIPWIQAGHIVYWGDLDSHGFAILHTLRSHSPDVTSVLMDTETLLRYRDLWVPEPKSATGVYPTLTPDEQRALERIRSEGNIRLEQERIAWEFAQTKLVNAAPSPTHPRQASSHTPPIG